MTVMKVLSVLLEYKLDLPADAEDHLNEELTSLTSEKFYEEFVQRSTTFNYQYNSKQIEVVSEVKTVTDSWNLYLNLKEVIHEKFDVIEINLIFH